MIKCFFLFSVLFFFRWQGGGGGGRCNYVGDIESGHKHSSHVISRRRALFLSFFHLSATVELLPTGVFSGDFLSPWLLHLAASSIFTAAVRAKLQPLFVQLAFSCQDDHEWSWMFFSLPNFLQPLKNNNNKKHIILKLGTNGIYQAKKKLLTALLLNFLYHKKEFSTLGKNTRSWKPSWLENSS